MSQQLSIELSSIIEEFTNEDLFQKEKEIVFSEESFDLSSDFSFSDEGDLDEENLGNILNDLGIQKENNDMDHKPFKNENQIHQLFKEVSLLKKQLDEKKKDQNEKEEEKWKTIQKLKKDNLLLQERIQKMDQQVNHSPRRGRKKQIKSLKDRSFSTTRLHSEEYSRRPLPTKRKIKPLPKRNKRIRSSRTRESKKKMYLKETERMNLKRNSQRKRKATATGVPKKSRVNETKKKKVVKKRILRIKKKKEYTPKKKLSQNKQKSTKQRNGIKTRLTSNNSGGSGRAARSGIGNKKSPYSQQRSNSLSAYGKFYHNKKTRNQFAKQKKNSNVKTTKAINKNSQNARKVQKKIKKDMNKNKHKNERKKKNKSKHKSESESDIKSENEIKSESDMDIQEIIQTIWEIFGSKINELKKGELTNIQQLESKNCYLIQTNKKTIFLWRGEKSNGKCRVAASKHTNFLIKNKSKFKGFSISKQIDSNEDEAFLKLFMQDNENQNIPLRKKNNDPNSPDIQKLKKSLERLKQIDQTTISHKFNNNDDDDNVKTNDIDDIDDNDDNDNGDDEIDIQPLENEELKPFEGLAFEIQVLNSSKNVVCDGQIEINNEKLLIRSSLLNFMIKGIQNTKLLLHKKFDLRLCLKIKSDLQFIFKVNETEFRDQIENIYKKLPIVPTILYTNNRLFAQTGEIKIIETSNINIKEKLDTNSENLNASNAFTKSEKDIKPKLKKN
ncbi:hypothetical protein M0813_24360 [Anaeramoeba flamelloides]|uniref:Gelsolin-like domain-containing protein n=1 Tax=Anaeramoeba flamelloides TaxID=1746091 RepID=A0ABQ8Y6I0_9EUKA|nr:hypothetical protein M0813_24360 [Anaeramoeba flamelloides]